MKLFTTKTTRELEALQEMEETLERRQRRQRVMFGIAVGTAILAGAIAVVRAITSRD